MGDLSASNDFTEMSSAEIEHFGDLARQFTKKQVEPMFEGEYPDGNPEFVPGIIDTAFVTGLASSPDKSSAGCEYGIFGCACDTAGLQSSSIILTSIASACGGIAMLLNTQGVASYIIQSGVPVDGLSPQRAGLCIQEGVSLPYFGAIRCPDQDLPARVVTEAVPSAGDYIINGQKSFVWSMPGVDTFVVFARVASDWGCFLVSSNSSGLSKTDAGWRTGLRSCDLWHLEFNNVKVPVRHRIDNGNAKGLLARAMFLNWLGMSAIAVGIAKGAIATAKDYTSQRYQGGTIIENHPAIKNLIGDSEARIAVSSAAVKSISHPVAAFDRAFTIAAMTKLMVMELCAKAVTDCLQTMGGYGYMEDFKIEKRLRDVATLKSAGGSPSYLKQIIFDIDREERK